MTNCTVCETPDLNLGCIPTLFRVTVLTLNVAHATLVAEPSRRSAGTWCVLSAFFLIFLEPILHYLTPVRMILAFVHSIHVRVLLLLDFFHVFKLQIIFAFIFLIFSEIDLIRTQHRDFILRGLVLTHTLLDPFIFICIVLILLRCYQLSLHASKVFLC